MIAVNTSAVNTALNAIADDLSLSASEVGWVVGIYLVGTASFVVLGGRLGDLFGERPVFLLGLVVFAVGAAVMAAAQGPAMAIGGRVVQGIGGAVLMPAGMAVLRIAFPPERQGHALGIWGAFGGAGFALGPLIGGALTDSLSWRWVWITSGVLALALALMAAAALRGMPRPTDRPRLDKAGICLLPLALFSLTLALQQGSSWGWSDPKTLGAFALAGVAGVALVVVELRQADPMLHLSLLRDRHLVAGVAGTSVNALFLIGILLFYNLWAQSPLALGESPLDASFQLLPYGALVFATSLVIGSVCDRVGFRWPIAAGLVLMGVAGVLLGQTDSGTGYGDVWIYLVILGAGVGITFAAPSAAGLAAIQAERAGEASGVINVGRYVSAALVVSLGTIAFTTVASDQLNERLDRSQVPRIEQKQLDRALSGAPSGIAAAERPLDTRGRAEFRSGGASGVADGFADIMLGLGVISLVAAAGWIVLMRPARAPGGA